MGIDLNTARFLMSAYEDGVQFDQTLTLGKLTLFVNQTDLPALQASLDRVTPTPGVCLTAMGSAEPVILGLGAQSVDSMDKSDFEGATLLHDMNLPIPNNYKERFSVVCDGGTLEHIFNFPVAIKNAMEMVKVGGHLIIQTPTNNWSGHGFYQFSPELYFRVLSEQNGFRLKRMVVFEWGVNKWYEVADPAIVRSRVYVVNSCRASLLILAERLAVAAINHTPPQQSDYALIKWTENTPTLSPVSVSTAPASSMRMGQKIATPLLNRMRILKHRFNRKVPNFFLQNSKFFTPVDR
ncbi:class I SAM-dependent methyltransferase [Myxacorys almedinensis]|uniref:Methyltransferase type 11 domain-containing protein n=1 Tax=Myxacorys almedinensis A TaxID=2690445 RepID=A0A8J8CJ89_9CYAN|nr:class I SAM-dependent methyltransferase [Myxacorys almedinensis]NDJ18753.1 hypothetical protein [Myxacorys almedinensis A]